MRCGSCGQPGSSSGARRGASSSTGSLPTSPSPCGSTACTNSSRSLAVRWATHRRDDRHEGAQMTSGRRVVLSLLFVAAVSGCAGSSSVSSMPTPSTTAGPFAGSGGYFALSVPDAEASAKWYADKLGLHVVMRPPKTNGTQVVVLEGSGL